MKIKKFYSKALTLSLLFSNINILSFASTWSEDGRYETFEGNEISIDNILDNNTVNIELSGNTFSNRISGIHSFQGTGWSNSDNLITFNHTDVSTPTNGVIWNLYPLKPGTEYSFVYTCLENSVVDKVKTHIDDGYYVSSRDEYVKMSEGTNVYKFKTKGELLTSESKFKLSVTTNTSGEGRIILKDVMMLEGDWTNKDVPKYFNGVKSSFDNHQYAGSSDSKYAIEVKSNSKNLVENLLIGGIHQDNSLNDSPDDIHTDYIKVKPSTTYTASNNGEARVTHWMFYDKEKRLINFTNRENPPHIVTTPENCEFIRITGHSNNREFFQIEENDTITEYTPYQYNTSQIYLDTPLLKGNQLEIIDGKLYHVQRYKQLFFDGSDDEGWEYNKSLEYYNSLISIERSMLNIPTAADIICDKFESADYFVDTRDMTYCIYSGSKYLNLIFPKNTSFSDCLNYLKNNPITVVYQLDNPIYELISDEFKLDLYLDKTNISFDSIIPASMKVTVDRTLNKATEAIALAKENPSLENISLARMWTNLANDSLVKDQLQSEINNITEIEDLTLEKKKATANLDIYVKSANTLSMALSTNSVSFDNYSGVSDMEKLKAVEITINSSLPYTLNAYLVTEIQNSDASKTMNRELFNIREASEGVYKKFTDIGQKLILKDDCASGNDIVHNIDMKLDGSASYEADVYKTVVKFEAQQK